MGVLLFVAGHFETFWGCFGCFSLSCELFNIFSWDFAQIFFLDNTSTVTRSEKDMACWPLLQVLLRILGRNFGMYLYSLWTVEHHYCFTKFCTNILAITLIVKKWRKQLVLASSLRPFVGIAVSIFVAFFHVMKNSKSSHIWHKTSWYCCVGWEDLVCFSSIVGFLLLVVGNTTKSFVGVFAKVKQQQLLQLKLSTLR